MMSRLATASAALAATLIIALAPLSHAADAVPTAQDPVSASRAVKLAEKLRCLVCQNQSIAESNAELALDLRRQINEQIAAGKTDQQIVDYMVARYGDFVLYQPPVKTTTLLLWAAPAHAVTVVVHMYGPGHVKDVHAGGTLDCVTPEAQPRPA